MKRYWPVLLFSILAAVVYADTPPPVSLQSILKAAPKAVPIGSDTHLTAMKGNTLVYVNATSIKPAVATTSSAGIVKVGTGLAVTEDGTLNNTGMAGVASFKGRGGAVVPATGDYSIGQITGASTVAATGSYNDLTNKPTIPAAQVNSDWNAATGAAQILNKPTIPTAISQLTQDSTHRTVTDAEKATWNTVTASVNSVNGQTATVVLTATDVGADPLGSATSVQTNLNTHTARTDNPHSVTKAQLGLGNVDNTSDAAKPISTATQSALNLKAPIDNPTFTTGVTAPVFTSNAADGTHRLNVRNSVTRSYTPQEGDLDTDTSGRIWLYTSGAWAEKGATYTLPVASSTVSGGVKVGSTLAISNGVLDVMAGSVGPSGLVTAGLAGNKTISRGFAYIATGNYRATFGNYSTGITTIASFGNYSGRIIPATGGQIRWANPVTFANNTTSKGYSIGIPPNSSATFHAMGDGVYYVTVTKNLQKTGVDEYYVAPPSYLVNENFDATVTGWTSAGTTSTAYANSPAPFGGSGYSASISSNSGTLTSPTFTAKSAISVKLVYYFPTGGNAGTDNILLLRDSSNTYAEVFVQNNGRLGAKHGTLANYGSASTAMVQGSWNYIWIDYTAGTGADGTFALRTATVDSKPVSPQLSISTGTSTGSVDRIRLFKGSTGNPASNINIFDIIKVSANAIN